MRSPLSRLAAASAVFALAACATPHPGSMAAAQRDPYEKTNRKIYKLNRDLDKAVVTPVTKVYRAAVPKQARNGITNGFNNLEEPISFVNAVLQGKIKQAFRTVDRFLINSTLGVGGLFDRATKMGRPVESEDFGQTFAVWGIPSGPYLMLPFFGPSTIRDAFGTGISFVADPVPYGREAAFHPSFVVVAGVFAGQTIDLRSKLVDAGADEILKSSLDEYATVKSAYLQRRQFDIYDGILPDEEDEPVEDAPLAPGATPLPQINPNTPSPAAAAPPVVPAPVPPQP